MNYSTDIIQEVTELNLSNPRRCAAPSLPVHADKLVRDSFVWSHLAGDSVQRMRTARRYMK